MKYTGFFKEYIDSAVKYINPQYPAWNTEYTRINRRNKWNYIDGCMIHSFLDIWQIVGNDEILRFCEKFICNFVNDDGSITTYDPQEYNLDNINSAKNLITLFEITGDEKYKKAFENVYNNQLLSQPRTTESHNFWHKKIYPQQVWLDGVYMALPFYAEYEVKYNNMKNIDDIINQFRNIEKLMKDKKTGLYYHGYDESRTMNWADKETGLSSCFWLRGTGWFISALVDTYEKVKNDSEPAEKLLVKMLKELVDSIAVYVHENGMFSQIIDMPLEDGNYCETSGTLLVSYAILKAVRIGMLDKSYRKIAENAFFGVYKNNITSSESTLNLGNICLVAGLGGENRRDGSVKYYLSEPIVKNDAKGFAPLFMAYSELIRTA